jgi:hypothetical protein
LDGPGKDERHESYPNSIVVLKSVKRPEYILDRASFTSTGALAREVQAWMEFSPCKIIVQVHNARQQKEIFSELECLKTMGRVKVEMVGMWP